jgi:hypothetical protein
MGKLIAFGWYGGKFNHLDWLLPLLPETTHYCEPFGGSAAVLLNRPPSPVETYNDIDGEVVNFFRVLRDQQEALIQAIGLTPFSREELRIACEEPTKGLSDLERARRFFVRAPGANGSRPNCQRGALGPLFAHQPRRHGRRRFALAGQRRGSLRDRPAAAARAD